ncbi:MAG: sulfide:quinone oxidoreductase [Solirubrobacteraceae bacterium]|jgi:sulfide:quinone oxidoreductase|nr:sulfide:quinone oxidoreductase [Solirubrobacteraceae bacterium]
MTDLPRISPLHVLIVGGGIAGIEAVLALHDLADAQLRVTLVAPEPDFLLRPMTVAAPFGRGHAARLPLTGVMHEHSGEFIRGAVRRVDVAAHTVTLTTGEHLAYDVLVLAPGASAVPAFLHALTFGSHPTALNGILADLEQGWSRSVAFVVPPGCSWPLPLYELALMTAEDVWSMNIDDAEVHLFTPEREPLELFGAQASSAVAALLAAAHISVHRGVAARIPKSGHIEAGPGREFSVDCVVALPLLGGPDIEGVPSNAQGFIPVDDNGLVDGLADVYAVGDATDRLIKQGGLACEQADVTAAHIARRAGADIEVPALTQVLQGRLLTGTGERFLRRERGDDDGAATEQRLSWAPAKVSGSYLAPYLVARKIVAANSRDRHEAGIAVLVR